VAYSREYPAAFSASYVKVYDIDGTELYDTSVGSYGYYEFDVSLEFDKNGGLWGYTSSVVGVGDYYLIHLNYKLDTELASVNDGTDFVYDLAVELDGDGVWYTDKVVEALIHRSSDGTILDTISLKEPRAICPTLNNGCWVVDNDSTDLNARKYDSDGNLLKTVSLEREASRMSTDLSDGFWYISGTYVYHVNSAGTEVASVSVGASLSRIKAGHDGCIVWSSNSDFVKYIDNDGNIVRTISGPSSDTAYPALFSHNYNNHVEFNSNLLPTSDDPVWGTSGSLEWYEVVKSGYFLPKKLYHQIEVTLSTDKLTSGTLDKILIPMPIKLEDLNPQDSRNVYVKVDIPASVSLDTYSARLKCWWGISDV
jgi:hypothetical protein